MKALSFASETSNSAARKTNWYFFSACGFAITPVKVLVMPAETSAKVVLFGRRELILAPSCPSYQ